MTRRVFYTRGRSVWFHEFAGDTGRPWTVVDKFLSPGLAAASRDCKSVIAPLTVREEMSVMLVKRFRQRAQSQRRLL